MNSTVEIKRLNRGEAAARVLNALNNRTLNIKEIGEATGLEYTQVGACVYRLVTMGRLREARREGRTVFYDRVPPDQQAEAAASKQVATVVAGGSWARFKYVFEQVEKERTETLEELGRLREENARLRRSLKDLAGKL